MEAKAAASGGSAEGRCVPLEQLLLAGRGRPSRILVVLRGLPGAGKSVAAQRLRTLVARGASAAVRIHSIDGYFLDEDAGRYEYDPAMEAEYAASLLKAFKKTIDAGADQPTGGGITPEGRKRHRPSAAGFYPFVVVDACHATVQSFEPHLACASRAGYACHVLELLPDTANDLELLVARSERSNRRTRAQIMAMWSCWERVPEKFCVEYGLRFITGAEAIVRQHPSPTNASGALSTDGTPSAAPIAAAAPKQLQSTAATRTAATEGRTADADLVEAGDSFGWGSGALIKQMFKLFDRDRDGRLNKAEYSIFCQATEGQDCDSKRWEQHATRLGTSEHEIARGLKLEHFARLYTETRFKRHYGKVRAELATAKQWLRESAITAKPGDTDRVAPGQTRKLKGLLRVGNMASAVVVQFTEPGKIGIEWDAESVLAVPNRVREVLSMVAGDQSVAARCEAVPELEYGCQIEAIQSDSMAAAQAKLQPGLCLRAINGRTIEGEETDAIIDMINDHPRSESNPLVLRLMLPRFQKTTTADTSKSLAGSTTSDFEPAARFEGPRPGCVFRAGEQGIGYYRDNSHTATSALDESSEKSAALHLEKRKVRWADEAAEDSLAEDDIDDMFAPQHKRQKTLVRMADGGEVVKKDISNENVPFHVRVQRELDEYAATLKEEKAKRSRLENIQTIRSREDPDELDIDTDEQASTTANEHTVKSTGPKIWGLKKVQAESHKSLTWGGATV